MNCAGYAKLGKYLNIMMPVTKDDFNKPKYTLSMEGFQNECSDSQKKYCKSFKTIPTKCVINQNNEAICEVGHTYNYQNQIFNIPGQTVMRIDASR